MKGLTIARFVLLIMVLSIISALLVSLYGSYFRDAIVKTSCPLVGEEYESGKKSGEGKCVIPAGAFE